MVFYPDFFLKHDIEIGNQISPLFVVASQVSPLVRKLLAIAFQPYQFLCSATKDSRVMTSGRRPFFDKGNASQKPQFWRQDKSSFIASQRSYYGWKAITKSFPMRGETFLCDHGEQRYKTCISGLISMSCFWKKSGLKTICLLARAFLPKKQKKSKIRSGYSSMALIY